MEINKCNHKEYEPKDWTLSEERLNNIIEWHKKKWDKVHVSGVLIEERINLVV